MSAVGIGIDIGNENSYIAIVKSGKVEVLDNEHNIHATPSYINFDEKCRKFGVGAKLELSSKWKNTVFNWKRMLGKKFDDPSIKNELKYLPHEVSELSNGEVCFHVNYLGNFVEFCIPQLTAMILTKMKRIAENKLGRKVTNCVLSVPVFYTDAQRRSLLDAAKIADLNPLRLMNETTAAALAYGFYQQNMAENTKVIFIDIGHTVTTITAVLFKTGSLRILSSVSANIGGRDFDYILLHYFLKEFEKKYRNFQSVIDELSNKDFLLKLRVECEYFKKLRTQNDVIINVKCSDSSVVGTMNTFIFTQLSAPLLKKIESLIEQLLKEANLIVKDITSIEVLGGTCRLPLIEHSIMKIFGQKPNYHSNHEELISMGCALECAISSSSLQTYIIEDICCFRIYINWKNSQEKEEKFKIFTDEDKIPSTKLVTFHINRDFTFEVTAVTNPVLPKKIGEYNVTKIPDEAKNYTSADILVEASMDINSIFSIGNARIVLRRENSVQVRKGEAINPDNYDTLRSYSQNTSDPAVKRYELLVTPNIRGLSEDELKMFIDDEKKMLEIDLKEEKVLTLKSKLQSYISDMKKNLATKYFEYIKEEERNDLKECLNNSQNWLDHSRDWDQNELKRKFKYVTESCKPMLEKYQKWEQIFSFQKEYKKVMKSISDKLDNLSDRPMIQRELENLKELWQDTYETLKNLLEACCNQEKSEDPITSAEDLRVILCNFTDIFDASNFDSEYEARVLELYGQEDGRNEN